MKLLLDTHVLIWASTQPHRLPLKVRQALVDPANMVLLSHICILEMEIKVQIGKLKLPKTIDQIVADQLQTNGMLELPQTLDHIRGLRQLPLIHRDPFDRLLISQAIHEQALFVTDDRIIPQYSVPTFWN